MMDVLWPSRCLVTEQDLESPSQARIPLDQDEYYSKPYDEHNYGEPKGNLLSVKY
jgi:hypothetical protein